ncbi:hypothetical protein FD755_007844, partial [Muntiacus reevesi]
STWDPPRPGIEPVSSALQGRFSTTGPPGKPCPISFHRSLYCEILHSCQASLSITNSWTLLKLMSIESVMASNHLIFCCPLLLPSIFPSIRVFSNESVLHIISLICLQAKGLSRVFSNTIVQKRQLLGTQPFLWSNSHIPYMTTGKTIALTIQTFVGKVMSLLFNMLSRLVIAFLPKSKCLLISWLHSPSAIIPEWSSVASVVSDSVRPHRRQPTRLPCPWDSPGKNTGVGCHFLLQCIKVKSESEVAQSGPTLSDSLDCSLPCFSSSSKSSVKIGPIMNDTQKGRCIIISNLANDLGKKSLEVKKAGLVKNKDTSKSVNVPGKLELLSFSHEVAKSWKQLSDSTATTIYMYIYIYFFFPISGLYLDGETVETVSDFFRGGSKITVDGEDWGQEEKGATEDKMKSFESPLDCKEIHPVHPKGDQSWRILKNINFTKLGRKEIFESQTSVLKKTKKEGIINTALGSKDIVMNKINKISLVSFTTVSLVIPLYNLIRLFVLVISILKDSMVKFYTCFPISMDGNQLSISMAPENMNLKDEEAIFTTLIRENDPEVNVDKIYDRFVHLDNLPEDGLQCVLCVGLQFGKVDHHVYMSNKNKAILQLDSPESAQSMYSFLKQNPQNIGDHVLSCTLSPKMDSSEVKTEKDPELGKESPDLKNSPVDESEVQTAADSPSIKPSEVEEESLPNIQTGTFIQQKEPFEEEPEKTLCVSDFALETFEVETQGEEVKVEIPLVASTSASIDLFTENVGDSVLNQQVYTSDFEKEETEIINRETELSTCDNTFIEEKNIKGILEDSPSEADFFSGITQSVIEAVAEVDKQETVSEIVPSTCVVALVPGISTGDEQAVSTKGISEKTNMDEKEENELNTRETRMDLKIGREKAEKNDRMVTEKLDKVVAAMKEKPAENSVTKACPNKTVVQVNKPDETSKISMLVASNASSSKSGIKADVFSSTKAKATASKSENQKSFLKSVLRDQINAEKRLSAKESGLLKATSARSGLAENSSKLKPIQSGVTRGSSGRISALQGKDSKLDYRDVTKQPQETEAKPSVMKRDDSNNKTLTGQNTKNPKNTTGRSSKSKEEPLFPFNLDEFVTVDEVIEEVNPFQVKQNPLKGKRKEALKNTPSSELNLKKKKGKISAPRVVEGELSFVTLDEIGEEEDAAAQLAQALVTVDEVIDEDDINVEDMVKNSNSLLTLDELIDQDDCISHSETKDVTVLSVAEEQDLLKQERLVTVDEIGEVEELPLNESADISFAALNTKGDEGNTGRDSIGFISSQMPEDPSTLVTVDEIQDDSSDLHLVTLDEVTEEDEDSLADFNNLKEELNFVTVDEVGEEEDGDNDLKIELTQRKNDHPTDKRGDRKKRTVDKKKTKFEALSQVGPVNENVMEENPKTMIERRSSATVPTKRVRIGKMPPSEKAVTVEPAKDEEAFQISEGGGESGLEDSEPEQKRKKIEDSSGRSVAPDVPEDLDFLVPKAGFFCPICSLFYSDEKAMTNHCKSTRHKQNTEKFMAKQRKEKEQNEAEERSSR